ncbi:hypothetical protein AB4455_12065 [Vibrio sp. 10N.261.46.E12]|nr:MULTISPECIES: hypothetical protein [unclassified Vibrio]OMO35714.1 hypothetical protein BH584_07410 [Vibrio sp. 10N.261.45.E1]PMJ22874.1 hypothetical protein BCU27_15940 [Vibrio sp. 10N.286.45.B6]PML87225.1 hypothetical protein BCT66_12610 [Vibrio sp. 10N.261.49.E11]PMM67535.1 hypothetical protein BCT48_14505 [Vibrio sp. 10N.261.46.F12]PMM86724.1 hypothetical protein BCT46_07705 [Vibrio sp. 10N.261.46.E8]
MQDINLYPLLHNRIVKENQLAPEYIGEFDGVQSLPQRDYPAIYYWFDQSNHYRPVHSLNAFKLDQWCREEALIHGLNMESIDASVNQAIETLNQISMSAFEFMIEEMIKDLGNNEITVPKDLKKPNRKRWWQIW